MMLTILAGTPRGGGQDRTARAIAGVMGVQVEILNLAGRGGAEVWERLAATPSSRDLLGVSSPTLITNRSLGISEVDDRSLTPVASLFTEYSLVLTRPQAPWARADRLIEALGTGHVRVAFATALGSVNHLVLTAIVEGAGAQVRDIPIIVHTSARHAMTSLISGEADVALVSAVSARPEVEGGEAAAVMVAAPERLHGFLSNVPTTAELGIESRVGMWRGLVAPPDLDRETIARLDMLLGSATSTARCKAA